LLIVGVALSSCTRPGSATAGATATTSASAADDTPVISATPRSTSRASSLVLIGYASKPNRALVEQAVAILRANGALATQRGPEIQRLHLKQLEEIGVTACDTSCPPSADILGISMPDQGVNPATVDCAVVLNMPLIQQQAREWSAPGGDVTALVLVHEQEHCLRLPEDDRETPSVEAELRLAQQLHNPHLVAFVKAALARLDASGHWKR